MGDSKERMLRRIAITVILVCVASGLAAAMMHLSSSATPFGGDVMTSATDLTPLPDFGGRLVPLLGSRVALVPDVVFNYLLPRLPLIGLVSISVVSAAGRPRPRRLLALSSCIPVFYEIALALVGLDGSWLGMLWAIALHWPNRPEYVKPAGYAVMISSAYLVPALAAAVTCWATGTWFGRDNDRADTLPPARRRRRRAAPAKVESPAP